MFDSCVSQLPTEQFLVDRMFMREADLATWSHLVNTLVASTRARPNKDASSGREQTTSEALFPVQVKS